MPRGVYKRKKQAVTATAQEQRDMHIGQAVNHAKALAREAIGEHDPFVAYQMAMSGLHALIDAVEETL